MLRLLGLAASVVLAAGITAPPAMAAATRIPFECTETRITEWTGGRMWVDEDLVLHIRNQTADYRESGSSVFCNGTNHATVTVNLDLTTGMGVVVADGRIELDGLDGGWDGHLVAHFTPGGPYIWEGTYLAHGFGALDGYQLRGTVVETTHEEALQSNVLFLPGS